MEEHRNHRRQRYRFVWSDLPSCVVRTDVLLGFGDREWVAGYQLTRDCRVLVQEFDLFGGSPGLEEHERTDVDRNDENGEDRSDASRVDVPKRDQSVFLSSRTVIMAYMNTTTGPSEPQDHEALLAELTTVDPADAPEVAKQLVDELSEDLEAAPTITSEDS